jgi:hypothetical protein
MREKRVVVCTLYIIACIPSEAPTEATIHPSDLHRRVLPCNGERRRESPRCRSPRPAGGKVLRRPQRPRKADTLFIAQAYYESAKCKG